MVRHNAKKKQRSLGVRIAAAATIVAALGVAGIGRTGRDRLVALFGVDSATAQSLDAPEMTDIQIDDSPTLPEGVFDAAALDRLPGIRAPQVPPPEVVTRVQALKEQNRLVRRPSRAEVVARRPNLVPPPDAPPSMDSGDPNPDRIVGPSGELLGR
jgi:hypothetical protein